MVTTDSISIYKRTIPFLRNGYAQYVKPARYRYRRIGLPLSAWLLALGQQRWIDPAYFAVTVSFIGLGIYWLSRFAQDVGLAKWWGLLYLLLPSSLIAMDRMIADGALATLFLGVVRAGEKERFLRFGCFAQRLVWFARLDCALSRVTPLSMRSRRRWLRAAWVCTTVVPLGLWQVYLVLHTQPSSVPGEYVFPLIAFYNALVDPTHYPLAAAGFIAGFDRLSFGAFLIILLTPILLLSSQRAFACVGAAFSVLAFYMSSRVGHTDFVEVYNYGRVYSPLFLLLILMRFRLAAGSHSLRWLPWCSVPAFRWPGRVILILRAAL